MHTVFQVVVTVFPDVLVVFLAGFLVLKFISGVREKNISLTLTDNIFVLFIFLNTIYGFILAMSPVYSLMAFRITYLPMLFYFGGRIFFSGEDNRKNIIDKLMLVNLFFSGIGLIIYFLFPLLNGEIAARSGYIQSAYFIPRMGSILWTPVLFGTLASMTCLWYSWKYLTGGNFLHLIAFTIPFAGLMLSVSRGPILGLLIGFIFLSVLHRKWKFSLVIFISMIIISTAVSFYATGSMKLLQWIFSSTADTVSLVNGVSRVNRWEVTWHDFLQRPWGYGLGKAGAVAFRYLVHSTVPAARYSTDGWLLKLACETGIFGVASYLVFCCSYFFPAFVRARRNPSSVSSFAIAIFLATNAQSIVSNVYDFAPYIFIYWLIIGISENERKEKTDGS
ncbi:MAG: O-antigen ligase family protein [Bacteroidetes bacterium]|nr:O-antigen ligase family protein [Bacteroidota bacterium]